MKVQIVFLGLIFLLTGCTSSHQVFKNQNHLPVQQETGLIGKSAVQIKNGMGAPLIIRTEDPNQVWTYRRGNCTTLLYFDKNEKVCFAESRGTCLNMVALD